MSLRMAPCASSQHFGHSPNGYILSVTLNEYDVSSGLWSGSMITAPVADEIPIDPGDILAQGANGNLVATGSFPNGLTRLRVDGEWLISPLLANATDLADNGTAIGTPGAVDTLPEILLNGQWTELERALSGIPESWQSSPNIWLSDTSPGGWILAHHWPGGNYEDSLAAALLPLRLKGRYTDSANNMVEEAAGVDDFSIGSSNPDYRQPRPPEDPPVPEITPAVQDRIWIMAPLGGPAKTVVLYAPIHSSAPVTLSAEGIRFGGQEEAVCNSAETMLSVAADSGANSGEEKLMNIRMGASESVSKPVGFKVMKARTVNVTVYKIGETLIENGEITQLDADLVPQEFELERFLNEVYRPQVNVEFAVDIKDIQVNTIIDHEPDGVFTGGVETLSPDQVHVRLDAVDQAGEASENTNITVYLLGTRKMINTKAIGTSQRDSRTCWVKSRAIQSYRRDEELAQMMNTISHEIGHVMIAAGHPSDDPKEDENGPAPLPGTKHSERLMRDGRNNPKGFEHLLVKAEWDEIQRWIKKEEDEGRIPN